MDNHLTFVSDSDSSNSSWSGLSTLVRNITRNLCHPLGHLSPQARNIYLVVLEPGTDPWDEPLDSGDFDLDPPCSIHRNCDCAWDDSCPITDHHYCSYPSGPEVEGIAGHRHRLVQQPVPVSLLWSQLPDCDAHSVCFGSIWFKPDFSPVGGIPHFRFCQELGCNCEPFLNLEVSRTCILTEPVPFRFKRWVAHHLRTSKLKF